MELTCAIGDELLAINKTHGWIWCAAKNGSEGWVPARNLEPI
ncbi:SH3 domain-containing protein [Pararhizobium sp. IMCC21322]